MERGIPKIISLSQEIIYLRALAETGNATLAAERAGVSRAWAYKVREREPHFDRLCREAVARLPARVNRDRRGGWTAAKEQRFLAALAATRDVPLAALQVGLSAGSAYYHRTRWRLGGSFHPSQPNECFAARWGAALADDETFAETQWMATLICLLDGEPIPPDYPVQTIGMAEIIRLYERSCGVKRGRPMRPPSTG